MSAQEEDIRVKEEVSTSEEDRSDQCSANKEEPGDRSQGSDGISTESVGATAEPTRKHTILLIGPTGSYKSATANQLVGFENPDKDYMSEAADSRLPFPILPYEIDDGSSVTKDCSGIDGTTLANQTPFYVIDTPGFGNTEESASFTEMVAADNLVALQIDEFLAENALDVDVVAFFLPNPILTRADPHLQQVLRSFLTRFDKPDELVQRMMVAQAFIQNEDVRAKERVAMRSRRIFRSIVLNVVREERIHCHIPEAPEFPYACVCPFADGGGDRSHTIKAFSAAVLQVRENIARTAGEDVQVPIRPRLPRGKCRRCSYDDARKDQSNPASELCHPRFEAQDKLHALKKGISYVVPDFVSRMCMDVVGAIVPTGANKLAAGAFQRMYSGKNWVCEACGRKAQTDGCTEMPHLYRH